MSLTETVDLVGFFLTYKHTGFEINEKYSQRKLGIRGKWYTGPQNAPKYMQRVHQLNFKCKFRFIHEAITAFLCAYINHSNDETN